MSENTQIVLLVLGVAALLLATQRWFWVLVFGLSALAASFSILASIIHFQILAAVGLTVLAVLLWGVTSYIAGGFD